MQEKFLKREIIEYLLDNFKNESVIDILFALENTAQKNLCQKRYNYFYSKFAKDRFNNRSFNGLVLNGVKYPINNFEDKKGQMIYSFLSYFDEESLFKLYCVLPKTNFKRNVEELEM